MKLKSSLLALAAATLMAAPGAASAQNLVTNAGLAGSTGGGFGNSNPLLTLGTNNNTVGAICPSGVAGCVTGDQFANGSTLYSSTGFTTPLSASNFALIFNVNEAQSEPSITINTLTLYLQATGATTATPINLVTTPLTVVGAPGTGSYGVVLALNAAGQTQFQNFLNTIAPGGSYTIGLAANLTGGSGGRESFLLSSNLNSNVVPEPSTYALMASGLLALGVVARRRRRA